MSPSSLFESVFNNSPIGQCLLSTTREATILAVNDAFLKASSRKREDLIEVSLFVAFPSNPNDSEDTGEAALRAALARVVETGKSNTLPAQRYPIRIETANGEVAYEERFWSASNTPIFDGDGRLQCILHSTTDITEQILAASALRESEKRFRALTNATADVVYRMSPDWSHMHELDGRGFLKDTDALGEYRLEDYVPPEDQDLARNAINEAIGSKTVFALEHRVLRVGGGYGWTYSRAVPLLNADGEIYEWIGAASDITDRKVAELNVKANTERYQTLFNSIDEGFALVELIFDANKQPIDYRFVEANPVFGAQTGLNNAVGKTARELVPDLEQRWFDIYGKVALTGESIRFIEGSSAMNRWFDVYATRVGDKNSRVVAILFKDISAQKHNEIERERLLKAAQTSHDQLMAVFQQAPAFMCILRGRDHVFEVANERYQQLIGWRATTGKTVREVLPEVIEQGFIQFLDDVYQTGKPFIGNGIRILMQHNADEPHVEHFVDFVYLPLRDTSDQVYGILVHGVDITERKRAEEELRNLADKLTDADRRKDEFLAMLAHELRNPLAPIGAAAELLQQVKLEESHIRKTSEVISRQVKHMTGLIDDLLDVSRVTRGLAELVKEVLDVRQIVAEAVEQVTPLIRSRQHYLALHLAPQAALIQGDKKRLVQVLANILNNAAKYTPEGGNIALRTEVQATHILIEVSDDGNGMTQGLAAHVFDLFAQAERTSDRSSGGLGLGLALVKSLAELHGGTVACNSAGLGKGSTFSVSLPRLFEQDQLLPKEIEENDNIAASAALRILVVDDNADAAEMLALLLRALGHEVLVEHDARQVLGRARVEKPQVCLLDIGLPEIDGNELAQQLRSHPETANSVLIAITGYGQENDRRQTQAAGFDHHLVKPVDTKKLASLLAEVSKS